VFIANNPDGGLQFLTDYWDINSKMIKNRYPLPLINETLNQLGNAKIYTKLYVWETYNLLWVREIDEYKLANQTQYVQLKPSVIQFGQTNAPAEFWGCIKNSITDCWIILHRLTLIMF
jgi:hypothetical protein